MRINKDYVLRQLGETWVILPLADASAKFSGVLTLNDAGVLLWKALENICDKEALVEVLLAEYEVSEEQARNDVEEFLDKLMQAGCLESI